MAIFRYENLTHRELSSLPRDKTAVFFPSGPLEQHGLHLPLGTDAFSAFFFSEQIASRLAALRPEWNFVIFPTLFAGCDTLTYAGSIEVRQWVIKEMLYDCCKQLAKDGFRTLIAMGTHGGPRHMVVLEEVAAKMCWRHRARMISASSRLLFDFLRGDFREKIVARLEKKGCPLSEPQREALKCDYHAGFIETSLAMLFKPELVKPLYKELKPALAKSYLKLRRSSGKTTGEGIGHLGSPALADPMIGQAVAEVFLDELTPRICDFLDGKNDGYFRSKLYYVPFFRSHFRILVLMLLWTMICVGGLFFLNQYLVEAFK